MGSAGKQIKEDEVASYLQHSVSTSLVIREEKRERERERAWRMLSLSVASPSSSTISFLPKPFNGIQLRRTATCSIPPTKRSSFVPVVVMSKRTEELKDIRPMTTERINEEVVDLKGELVMLRLQKSARNEFKSSEFGRMRKRVLQFCFTLCSSLSSLVMILIINSFELKIR